MFSQFVGRVKNLAFLEKFPKFSELMRKQCASSVNNAMIVIDTSTYRDDVSKSEDAEQGSEQCLMGFSGTLWARPQ